jgi:outer membrane protein TolC
MPGRHNGTICLAGVLAAALGGCTPAQYAEQADSDAYATLGQTQRFALGSGGKVDATYTPFSPGSGKAEGTMKVGETVISLRGADVQTLTLDECLQIAFRNSREFQTQKETLYTAALALANSRRGWNFPLLGGSVTGEAGRSVENRGAETNAGAMASQATLTQQLVHGGALTLGVGVDMLSDLLGWRSTTLGSLLSANFTQPLLRGAWRGLAYEEQYRAERDFVFSVLEYERFTQTFGVDILSQYYAVLEQRDRLENERDNIKRLEDTFAVTKLLARIDSLKRIQQDQAETDLVNAQVRFETNQQLYHNALDRFKITLGLPIAARVEPAYPEALKELNTIGPKEIPVAEGEAMAVALETRPDVLRQAASLRDAERDVEIAADAFLPALDVTLGISAAGTAPRKFTRVGFHRHTRAASATLDYELDQTLNRDVYRNAMIARDQARRGYAEFIDQLQLEIRQSYRSLLQSRKSYELELRSVAIAKRRRKLAVLQHQEGQATARDVLEAEDGLRRAQNGVTSALISYTTTRLQFMTTLGLLRVDEKGQLHERAKPFKFDRIRKRYPYVPEP